MMNRLLFPFVLFFGSLNLIHSQDPSEVFKDENNRLFINKNQGVYLWLSTSPNENSEKIRLESDSSKNYTNPMYFDTEGYNTFRSPSAVDTSTKKAIYPLRDIIFEVYADGLPPKTGLTFPGATKKTIESKLYLGGDFKITLTAQDAVSGIAEIFYASDNSEFKKYTGPIVTNAEGKTTFKFYSIDKVGNKEEISIREFYIDTKPPVTEVEIEGLKNKDFVSLDAKVKLISKDELSGVAAIYYKINNGSFRKYTYPISVKYLADNGVISFYAVDKLGNKEKIRFVGSKESGLKLQDGGESDLVFEFYVDKEPPSVEIDHEGDFFEGKYNYISGRTKFKVISQDEKSGVDKVLYSINSTTINEAYKEPFSYNKEELITIRARATDFVGNKSTVASGVYYCDIDPPASIIIIGKPKYQGKDTIYVSSDAEIMIRAVDKLSGVKATNYATGNEELKPFSQAFKLNDEGLQSVRFQSIDNVNNSELDQKQEIFVDNIPPEIYHHFSTNSIGKKSVREEEYTIYPTNMQLYIAATDIGAGGGRIEYKINGGSILKTIPIEGLREGNYQIEIKAYDVLGNSSSKTIKFALER